MTLSWYFIFNNIIHSSVFSQPHPIEAIATTLIWMSIWAWSLVAHLNDIAKKWEFLRRMLWIWPIRTITIWSLTLFLSLLLSLFINLFAHWVYYLNSSIKVFNKSNVFLFISSLFIILHVNVTSIRVRFNFNSLSCINFISFLLVGSKRGILNLYKISLLTIFFFNLRIVLWFSFHIWSTHW